MPARDGSMVRLRMRLNGYERWVLPYLLDTPRRMGAGRGPVHLILAIADHYEPKGGGASAEQARARVGRWLEDYPRRLGGFRDSDGRPPRHTFFYPAEEYEAGLLDDLGGLCRDGYGEVEVHLHHDGDTSENLRRTLLGFKETLHARHGLLPVDPATGGVVYAFVHGNWALDNSRPDGRWCGVDDELSILRETGCYADFTMPSAPHPTQVATTNRIYYATDDPRRPRSHERGVEVGRGAAPAGGLLMVQGPLVLDWGRRKWGVVPRLDNGALQRGQEPSMRRLGNWLRAGVRVPGRPDWCFVKLHAHGAHEHSHEALLGGPMVRFHEALAARAGRDPGFRYHYVTAREMVNLVEAAAAGWRGGVDGARDHRLRWGTPAAIVRPGVGK